MLAAAVEAAGTAEASFMLLPGHLGASLGVVELTVALHHVFSTPDDKASS